jgi:RNA polymerase sigma-70 factor (ECF subfamily)
VSLPSRRRFPSTCWSLVSAAGAPSAILSHDALSELCETYWLPVYSYLRGRGFEADRAQDLTQAFFARLVEKQTLTRADPERGRFRTFLLSALTNFVANERAYADRRGGRSVSVSLDATLDAADRTCVFHLRDDLTPEDLYCRRWVTVLLARVLHQLRDEFVRAGRTELFESLKPYLTGGKGERGYRFVAVRLNMTEGALKVAIHRFRRRYRELLYQEIGRTVATPDQVEQEIRDLLGVLRGQRRANGVHRLVVQTMNPR